MRFEFLPFKAFSAKKIYSNKLSEELKKFRTTRTKTKLLKNILLK